MQNGALGGVESISRKARNGDTQKGYNALERSTENVDVQLQNEKSNDEHASPTLHTCF